MSQRPEVTLASLNSHVGRRADGAPFDLAAACRSLAAAVTLLQECWHGDSDADPLPQAAAELGARILRADLPPGVSPPPLSISGETSGAAGDWRSSPRCRPSPPYSQVPDRLWRAGRAEVLSRLLDRGHLYRTPGARGRWEAAARANLQRELARLG
jgi:hypothetical protein